jgi:hypothetical protein
VARDPRAANDLKFLPVEFDGWDNADVGQSGFQAVGAFGWDGER